MKKLLLIAVIAVFGFSNANAQVTLGVKAGVDAAFLTGDVPSGTMNFGINAGFVAEFQLSDKWALQSGVIFAMQGAKTDQTVDLIFPIKALKPLSSDQVQKVKNEIKGTEYTVSLNYINVPIIAKYYITDHFNVQLGPQIGFLVSADGEAEPNFNIPNSTLRIPNSATKGPLPIEEMVERGIKEQLVGGIKDHYNTVYVGLKAGAGYKLDNGLFFNLYYNMGLTDIKKGGKTIHNAGLQLSVGYMF